MDTQELTPKEPPPNGRKFVNRNCWIESTEGFVTVFVKGLPLLSFDYDDLAAKHLAMVMLAEQKIANQESAAKAFGVDRVTLYRLQKRYRKHGVAGLVPKKRGPKGPRKTGGRRDKAIIKMIKDGKSNRSVAKKLAVSEHAIREALKRMGYRPKTPVQQELPVLSSKKKKPEDCKGGQGDCSTGCEESSSQEVEEEVAKQDEGSLPSLDLVQTEMKPYQPPVIQTREEEDERIVQKPSEDVEIPAEDSYDPDPSNRVFDRFLARMGLLYDAAPLFQAADAVPGVGVLLAIPILVAHGVFADAMRVFNGFGPSFYGLRNTVVTLLTLFLRGINRPENLKEHSPAALGKVMGLDRAPEMKTLRRKIRNMVFQNKVVDFIKLQVQRHLRRMDKDLLWLYVDGHVSAYSGKRKLSKHYMTRLRISMPSVLDYWVNDEKGDPLLVLTGRPRKGMVSVIEDVIEELRGLGEERPITLVFDREGWSPALFARLDAMEGIRFVTYRKAKWGKKLPRLPAGEFEEYKREFEGEKVEYNLADKQVYIDYGTGKKKKRLKLRQITRLTEEGKQTHVVTNDKDTPTIEIAHRMFSRWSQENFLKYMRNQKDLDGLVTYLVEEADDERPVPNPKRKALNQELKRHRAELDKLMSEYGELALRNRESSRPTMRGFKIANGKLGQEIERKKEIIDELDARRRLLPAKVPLSATMPKDTPKKVHTETRRFIHAFRMVSYRAETALRELLRSEYPRWRQESRTLIRMFLNSTGNTEVNDGKLVVTLDEQSSPHRTRLLAYLCDQLNSQETKFPGSDLVLRFGVREADNVAQSA